MAGLRKAGILAIPALTAPGGALAANGMVNGTTLPWLLTAGIVVALGGAAGAVAGMISQRRARARAEERARLLKSATDALPEARMIVGPDGAVVSANAAWEALFGRDRANPLAPLEAGLIGDEEEQARFRRLADAVTAGTTARADLRFQAPGGGIAWRAVSVATLDVPGYALWGAEDITARKEIDQIIHEEQERLIDFLENAPIGFYSVDGEGRFLFINRTLAGWLGVTPDEVVDSSRRLADFTETGSVPWSPFRDERERGEVTLKRSDGQAIDAFVAQTVLRDDESGMLRTRSLVRDLTAERQSANALRLSEQRFHRFFEEAPLGIVLLDAAGNITEHNSAFADVVKVENGGAAGRRFTDFVKRSDRADVEERLTAARDDRSPDTPLEVALASGEGEATVSMLARRLDEGAAEGGQNGLILHLVDITEQKTLEAQFLQSQKMELVGQLAGGVAHDFNNLLTAIIGFCDLLLLRHRPGDQSFADIMQIRQNSNRAANLVRQLLAFSRQQTLQPKVLNVVDVLAELSNLLRRLIGASIELKMIHGRDLGLVMVDQGQLEQVIINLAVNARDAMGEGGTLTIRTLNVPARDRRLQGLDPVADADYVGVEITDTGCGIARDHLDKIFEPFFTTKEVGMGTGLGLSTVYGIIKQTGGLISVDSEVGRGTSFTIFLPRHEAVEGADTARPDVRDEDDGNRRDLTGAGTILLVEDEDAVRKFGARALRNKGYTVIEAENGEGALEFFNAGEKIDIMVTDVVMPGVDGPSLIRQVRDSHPDLKIICISGYTEDSFRQRLDFSDNIHFLPKPFSLQQLAGKVKEVIHK